MSSLMETKMAQALESLRDATIPVSYEYLFKPKLPRVARTSAATFFDYTPNSCHPAAYYKFPTCPVQYDREIRDKVMKEGETRQLSQADEAVIQKLIQNKHKLDQTCDFSRLFVKPWLNMDTRFSMCLPPKEMGNNTGWDFLLETDSLFKQLVYLFADELCKLSDITGDDVHYFVWMFVSTVENNPFTQIVLQDDNFKIDLPQEFVSAFAEEAEDYLSFVEQNALKCSAEQLLSFASDMKPYKSLGFSNRNVDGSIFSRSSCYEAPMASCLSGFESEEGKFNEYAVLHNGWLKTTTLLNKIMKLPLLLGKLKRRLVLADKDKFDDPDTVLELMLDDNANVSTLGTRINNPDEILNKDGEKITSLRSFLTHVKGMLFSSFSYITDFASKPREATFILDRVYHSMKVSPSEYTSLKKEKCEDIKQGRKEAWIMNKGERVPWTVKAGFGISKRIRGIMPACFHQTLVRNCWFKLVMSFLETSAMGFPSCSEKNLWYEKTSEFLEKQVKGRLWYAIDLSHFETVGSTNYEVLLSLFGTSKRRRQFIRDCGWTILAAMYEPLYSKYLVASGSPVTSGSSLFFGCMINAFICCQFDENPLSAFRRQVRLIFQNGKKEAAHFFNECGVINQIPDELKELGYTVSYSKSGKEIENRTGEGSDDQSGCLASNDYTDGELKEKFESNPTVKQLSERGLLTYDVGEFTSFGVKRTRDTVTQDLSAVLSKLFLIEFDTNSEEIMFGFYLTLTAVEGAADCLERAILRLNAETGKNLGDVVGYYRLAAIHYLHTLDQAGKERLYEAFSTRYPEESPRGRAVAAVLEKNGYKNLASNKVPKEYNEAWLKTILKFNQGYDMKEVCETPEPDFKRIFPNFNLANVLAFCQQKKVSVSDQIKKFAYTKQGENK